MGRRWIAAGLVLVALMAALAALVLGRADPPYPKFVWYCAASREVRETPRGATRSDLSAYPIVFNGANGRASVAARNDPSPPDTIFVLPSQSLVERAIEWIDQSPRQARTYRATRTVETADGRSWERFDFGLPLAPSPR